MTEAECLRRANRPWWVLVFTMLIWAACTEIQQTVNPSPVDISISTPTTTTTVEPTPPPAAECRVVLEPPSPLQVVVGHNVNVKVVTFNASGGEIATEAISVNVADPSIANLSQIDGRFVMFEGVSAGETTAIISTACGQTAVTISVVAV